MQAIVFGFVHNVSIFSEETRDGDSIIKLWDLSIRRTVSEMRSAHKASVGGIICVKSIDQLLLTQARDGYFKLWNLEQFNDSASPLASVPIGAMGFCKCDFFRNEQGIQIKVQLSTTTTTTILVNSPIHSLLHEQRRPAVCCLS
jgi:WD40 repeat protein